MITQECVKKFCRQKAIQLCLLTGCFVGVVLTVMNPDPTMLQIALWISFAVNIGDILRG